MSNAIDRASLLTATAIVDLLGAGWRPGQAEMNTARYAERWAVLAADDGVPFRIIGFARSLPEDCRIFTAPLIAIDPAKKWVRTLDEWIAIGDALDEAPDVDAEKIYEATTAWLYDELGRHETEAGSVE